MKLKVVNHVIKRGKGKAFIHFGKSGCILLNCTACEKLGITGGEGIQFFYDEEQPRDWYFEILEPSEKNLLVLKIRKKT